jgi:hypothetical protein
MMPVPPPLGLVGARTRNDGSAASSVKLSIRGGCPRCAEVPTSATYLAGSLGNVRYLFQPL